MQFADPRVAAVFAEYEQRRTSERERIRAMPAGAFGGRRDEFLLSVGPEAAAVLHALVVARAPRRILELGTSFGYSTLFLADAARACGAQVVSIDLDAGKQAYASGMLEKAGLGGLVDLRAGDALDLVAADDGPFDFVLLDVWKDAYVACFEAVYPKLGEAAILVTDNMIEPASARPSARALREAVRGKPDLQTVLLPVGQGIELTVKWSPGNPNL